MNGGEERREGNQHIEYLLCGRNNVLLNVHKSSEDGTYHYHAHFLYEEISAQSEIFAPEHPAKMYPFDSKALVYFSMPQGLCTCCALHVDCSFPRCSDGTPPPSFRSSLTCPTWYKIPSHHSATFTPFHVSSQYSSPLTHCICFFCVLSPLTNV